MKDLYYQFVNFIQEMPYIWYVTILFGLIAFTFILIVKFYKIYNGTQAKFEKLSWLIWALIFFAMIIYLTYIRN